MRIPIVTFFLFFGVFTLFITSGSHKPSLARIPALHFLHYKFRCLSQGGAPWFEYLGGFDCVLSHLWANYGCRRTMSRIFFKKSFSGCYCFILSLVKVLLPPSCRGDGLRQVDSPSFLGLGNLKLWPSCHTLR